jgi:2-polyprenyl-3-methyl-5-hydroxy-6-metoxy-1,4-benzoquinol methylase
MTQKDLTTYENAVAWIAANYPPIAGGLIGPEADVNHRELAHEVYRIFLAKARENHGELEGGLESFAQMSFDFLRLQSRFLRSGRYEAQSAKKLLDELYLDEERMKRYYLDGLLLTYAFWPNHIKLLEFFRNDFLTTIHNGARIMEIGIGHGLMCNMALSTLMNCHYTGLDISPSSLSYARGLWQANGIDLGSTVVEVADAVTWVPPAGADGVWDAVICCEVLEHVESPETVLEAIGRSLSKEGTAFITTVANVAAEDHIYLFRSIEEIRKLCVSCGLPVIKEASWALRGFEKSESRPLNYAALLKPVEKMRVL